MKLTQPKIDFLYGPIFYDKIPKNTHETLKSEISQGLGKNSKIHHNKLFAWSWV
jgi:hypothetical protein